MNGPAIDNGLCAGCGLPIGVVGFDANMMRPDLPARVVCASCWPLRESARPGHDTADRLERCSACSNAIGGLPFCAPGDDRHERPLCLACWTRAVEGHKEAALLAEREAKRLAHVAPKLLDECRLLLEAWDKRPDRVPARVEAVRVLLELAKAA